MGKSKLKIIRQKMAHQEKNKEDNVMKEIAIDKLVINCSVGESGDKILKAVKVLKDLTGQEPVTSKCKYTIRSFGVRRGDKIACHVTVRGDKAKEILERGLKVKEYELPRNCFSEYGHFGFGITEHIDLGIRYDPYTGIFGMDFYCVLKKPGYRVSRKKRCRVRIGNAQKIEKDEAKEWFKREYDGILI